MNVPMIQPSKAVFLSYASEDADPWRRVFAPMRALSGC